MEKTVIDITNSKDYKELSSALISNPTLLAGISHEVRTHMNAIVAFSYLMNQETGESDFEQFRRQIHSSCEQLCGLLDNFLDTAIIESVKQKTNLRSCHLSNILDELITEFRDILNREWHRGIELVAENAIQENIELSIDTDRVFRIIRILFQCSLKNTASGYIKIGYSLREKNLTFHLIDSGQGYFQCKEFLHTKNMNESLSRYNDTGTAINIILANKLIQLLGGTFRIECNGLTGAAFYFSIPVAHARNQDIDIQNYITNLIAI